METCHLRHRIGLSDASADGLRDKVVDKEKPDAILWCTLSLGTNAGIAKESRMKRIFILLVIAMVAVGAFAAENTLIDFTLLTSDVTVGEGDAARPEHERTLVDFAEVAGASFTEEERGLMKSSLFIENWERPQL